MLFVIKIHILFHYFQVVCAEDSPPRSVEMQYHLLETTPCPPEGMDVDGSDEIIKPYLKAGRMLPLDTFSITNGPYTSIFSKLSLFLSCKWLFPF